MCNIARGRDAMLLSGEKVVVLGRMQLQLLVGGVWWCCGTGLGDVGRWWWVFGIVGGCLCWLLA